MSLRFIPKIAVRLLALVALLSCTLGLAAQNTASIVGTVSDSSGAVVPGAIVTLTNTNTGAAYKGVTNSIGFYTISNAAPGPNYSETVEKAGFEKITVTGIYMNVDSTRTQNVKLLVGATENIEVKAAGQDVTLNTTDATVGNNFQVQFVQQLPVEIRDSPAVLFSDQPGVTASAVTGARTDQSNVTLDGLEVNDAATGGFGAAVGGAAVDSIQEFRGTVAGMNSSAGQGGGGQFDLVTRSGTNHFHGNINEYHRDAALTANTWSNKNNTPITVRPPLVRNQFGGNIGGPVLKDKLFFFFNYDGRKDAASALVTRTVPMNDFRNQGVDYVNSNGAIETANSAEVASLDPEGIGFNAALAQLMTPGPGMRYPVANDLSGDAGDLVNTAGYRFNAPDPFSEKNFVTRIDYNLNSAHKVFGRFTIMRETTLESAQQYPSDPVNTFPYIDKTYAWVVGDTWTIGTNKVNSAYYGIEHQNLAFPNTYNPQGSTQYSFGGTGTGGVILSGAYPSAINAQNRVFPIPVIRDDFSWTKGRHNLTFGGTFKYENPYDKTYLNYNSPLLGLGGHLPGLTNSLRPADISNGSADQLHYDEAFALALGNISQVASTFNYTDKGTNLLQQGSGSEANYRFYETELYFGDTWKVTPHLTLTYGLRWQNYSVPYEKNGIESVPNLDFDQYFGARQAQSAAGDTSETGVPFVQYVLGGKANNGPGYFNPVYKDFAPRLAFAWNPGFSPKTTFNGAAGIIYDHTVVNAIQYQASQYSYLSQTSPTLSYGNSSDPVGSLTNDIRFAGITGAAPAGPQAPASIAAPFTPYVGPGDPLCAQDALGTGPCGLAEGQAFNEGVDKNLKTPYSITYNFGFQHEFPQGFLLHATYVGRLGRRLLAQADANQLIDFPDKQSGQMMSTAFALLEKQYRAGTPDPNTGEVTVTPQPWFEDVLTPNTGALFGAASNTDFVANGIGPYVARGDFADTIAVLASLNSYLGSFGFPPIIPFNVGMGSQFSEFTYYTNKGFSSYNGLLVTLHKNASHGVQFDLNYTWSHSIDNVSVVANAPAIGGYGFICDVVRPRECRGNSDFDLTNVFNGNFIWELPVGRGREIGGTMPHWADEIVGGWSVSGLPSWQSGTPYFATSNAFVAGYANNAPAILAGNPGDLKWHLRKGVSYAGATNAVVAYGSATNTVKALSDFTGPVGFQIGGRNNLRTGSDFGFDAGLAKVFPIREQLHLQFRADAFNVLNHPTFGAPNTDITQSNVAFGTVPASNSQRILQVSARLEF